MYVRPYNETSRGAENETKYMTGNLMVFLGRFSYYLEFATCFDLKNVCKYW